MAGKIGKVLLVVGVAIGLLGLATGGFVGMLLLLSIYYILAGFILSDFTEFDVEVLTWPFDLFDLEKNK